MLQVRSGNSPEGSILLKVSRGKPQFHHHDAWAKPYAMQIKFSVAVVSLEIKSQLGWTTTNMREHVSSNRYE